MESLCRETRAFITLVASLGFFALPCSASAGDYMVRVLGDERAVRIGTRDSVTWGDAERLLFAAYDPRFKSAGPVDKGEKGEPVILPNLYEWDVRTDKLRVVYDLGDPSFCLSGDGYTSSKIWRNGKRFERAGFFGKEIERPFSPASYSEAYRDDVLCRPNPSIENRPAKRQGATRQLLPGHGYLEVGVDRANRGVLNPIPTNLWFYPDKDHPGIELPIASKDAGFFLWFRFSRFANAYVLRRLETNLKPGMTGIVWLVRLDGSVTTITVPSGPWLVGHHYWPTRAGMYFSSDRTGASAKGDVGHAGGYLLKDGSVKRLFSGLVYAVDVAPDGCRIAAVVNPYVGSIARRRLYVVNVCD